MRGGESRIVPATSGGSQCLQNGARSANEVPATGHRYPDNHGSETE